jgi:hypothetical protein
MTGLLPAGKFAKVLLSHLSTETMALGGAGLGLAGFGAFGYALSVWFSLDFGNLTSPLIPRLVMGGLIDGAGDHVRTLPRYFAVQAGCALMSGGLSHLLATTLGWPAAAASAVMTVCVAAVSYLASSLWVFADEPRPG